MGRTISLLLALLLCFSQASPALAADVPFKDVPSEEIMEAYTNGAVQGTSASEYLQSERQCNDQ